MKRRRLLIAIAFLLVAGGVYYWHQDWLEHSQDAPIRRAAMRYGVDPALVKAIVWRESRFNPIARGRAGELGLMQLREPAALEWADAEHLSGYDHLQSMHPGTNTLIGTWYLSKLLKRYSATDNPLPYALADYNAGRGNVLKWIRDEAATNSSAFLQQIEFPGTKAYVAAVIQRYDHYRPSFGSTKN